MRVAVAFEVVAAAEKKRDQKFIHTIFVALRPQGFHTLSRSIFSGGLFLDSGKMLENLQIWDYNDTFGVITIFCNDQKGKISFL